MASKSSSPCINECSEISAGGDKCNRCLRTAEEALGWNQYSDNKRIIINERCIVKKLVLVLKYWMSGKLKPALIMRKLDEILEGVK